MGVWVIHAICIAGAGLRLHRKLLLPLSRLRAANSCVVALPDKFRVAGYAPVALTLFQNCTRGGTSCILLGMKISELTPERISSVPCPTCGVAAQEHCVLQSGLPRHEPHIGRRFAAIESIKKNLANSR